MTRVYLRLLLVGAFALLPCTFMGCGPSDEVPAEEVEQHEVDAAAEATDDESIP